MLPLHCMSAESADPGSRVTFLVGQFIAVCYSGSVHVPPCIYMSVSSVQWLLTERLGREVP